MTKYSKRINPDKTWLLAESNRNVEATATAPIKFRIDRSLGWLQRTSYLVVIPSSSFLVIIASSARLDVTPTPPPTYKHNPVSSSMPTLSLKGGMTGINLRLTPRRD